MKLKNTVFLSSLVVIALSLLSDLGASAHATAKQVQQAKPKCPITKVTCSDTGEPNQSVSFTADVRGSDPRVTPTYNWTVSAGTIESGQGTSTVDVNTTGLPEDSSVTATVELGGFDRECGYAAVAASCTTMILKKPEAHKLDEYGKVTPKDEDARLDNFVIELHQDPMARAYIIVYSGRSSVAGYAQKAANRRKEYLVKKRGVDVKRVVAIDGGARERPATELWIVPSGAEPPKPAPTIKHPAKAKSPAKP